MPKGTDAEWQAVRNAVVLAGVSTATVSMAVSYHEFQEPGHDIAELDRAWEVERLTHPFGVAHRMGRHLLRGASEMVGAATRMVAEPLPLLVSPAPLARSAVEYSSRVWYLSQQHRERPEERLARLERLLSDGLRNRNARGRLRNDVASERLDDLEAWLAAREGDLRRIRVPTISDLVDRYLDEIGVSNPKADTYKSLSAIAHGNLVELDAIAGTAFKVFHADGVDYNRLNTYARTLFTIRCVHGAASIAHQLSFEPERRTAELVPGTELSFDIPISQHLASARGLIGVAEQNLQSLADTLGMKVLGERLT
ncbi:hypothetical protein [Tsukamurella tyrosinosolvens]|uniref:hypothetical protein n=1 Tax=Tsukamurella tyrosinosolvens TaxID=57704 RepID=UPI00125F4FE1|nr:hypothetical protein [Tsukamurella tyrosinosolvens]